MPLVGLGAGRDGGPSGVTGEPETPVGLGKPGRPCHGMRQPPRIHPSRGDARVVRRTARCGNVDGADAAVRQQARVFRANAERRRPCPSSGGSCLWVIWIWILIMVFIDIFRSHDLSGGAKALVVRVRAVHPAHRRAGLPDRPGRLDGRPGGGAGSAVGHRGSAAATSKPQRAHRPCRGPAGQAWQASATRKSSPLKSPYPRRSTPSVYFSMAHNTATSPGAGSRADGVRGRPAGCCRCRGTGSISHAAYCSQPRLPGPR